MKIAIIGSSGFIGGNLIKEFKTDSNIDILKIDKNKGSYKDTIKADVRCLSSLKNAVPRVDTIINLAAEHKDNVKPKKLYYDVNVLGAVNVCKLAEFRKINRIIFTSSVAVYGFQSGICGESVNPNPFNEYGKTKLSAEKIYTKWFKKDPNNRSLIILRPTVVFGEGNRGNVYNLINQIHSGFFLMIGKGENIKSMAYVNNLTQFIMFCANFKKGFRLYNYVDKPDFNMNKLVQLISSELNKKLVRLRIPRSFGLLVGKIFDFFSTITGINFPISTVRVQKFCSNSSFSSSVLESGFKPKFLLKDAFIMTISKEFKK